MAIITARVDDEVKTELYTVAHQLGIPVSSLINARAKELIRKRNISFSLDDEYLENLEMHANKELVEKKLQRSVSSGR